MLHAVEAKEVPTVPTESVFRCDSVLLLSLSNARLLFDGPWLARVKLTSTDRSVHFSIGYYELIVVTLSFSVGSTSKLLTNH